LRLDPPLVAAAAVAAATVQGKKEERGRTTRKRIAMDTKIIYTQNTYTINLASLQRIRFGCFICTFII
jgi:hypothetical protein